MKNLPLWIRLAMVCILCIGLIAAAVLAIAEF